MKKSLLTILVCPKCKGKLDCIESQCSQNGDIESGELNCPSCKITYPISNAIPRFVEFSNYTNSFGYQWNKYKHTQIDRFEKNAGSRRRFNTETAWDLTQGKPDEWMLDVGCGNGRFLDISSESKLQVVGLDMSNAVDAAYELLKDRPNLHLVQASIYEPPFKDETFDYCYSIGVIQHTPDPEKTIKKIALLLKKGGHIALTMYENKKWTYLNSKYLIRPLTKRINDKLMLIMLKVLSPVLFPITCILYRIPGAMGKGFQFIIPYANYIEHNTSLKNRYSLSILDTFDMLTPAYDQPQRQNDVERYLAECEVHNIQRLSNAGLNLTGKKRK